MKLNDVLSLYKGTTIEAPLATGLMGIATMANSMLDCNCVDCGGDANCSNCN